MYLPYIYIENDTIGTFYFLDLNEIKLQKFTDVLKVNKIIGNSVYLVYSNNQIIFS